jgi:predicted dehydrogenase
MKLGVVGSGPIVPFHLDALVDVGFDVKAIASRPGSLTTRKLAEKYLATPLNDFYEVAKTDIDAVLIAPASGAIGEALKHFIKSGIPILVEKPVLKDTKIFEELGDLDNQNVIVGYNRRFYSSVQELKSSLQSKQPHSFLFKVPENSWNGDLDLTGRRNFLIDNTVHMVDLLRYLVGNSAVKATIQDGPSNEAMKVINMFIEGADISGIFQITFDSPGAYSVEFNGSGFSSKLQPIEYLNTYDAIEVIEPTSDIPIRRYQPKLSSNHFSISEFDLKYKPGFFQQSKAFADLVNGKQSQIAANLYDAFKAIELVEKMTNLRGQI